MQRVDSGGLMGSQDLIDRARQQLATFNAKDWSRYQTEFTDDALYDEEATHRLVKGPDEIVQAVKLWTDGFHDAKGSEVSVYAQGDTVILEILWQGTNTRRLFGALAGVPPSGKKVKVPAVQVIRFDGDKIAEIRHYFDLMTVLEQIGAAPQPQPAP
jgi:steroid delta-isomerase-like uncharacterized protein